jgi:hypothetical protein
VIPLKFADAEDFSEGLAAVRLEPEGGIGFIDTSGKMVIPALLGMTGMRFSEGLAGRAGRSAARTATASSIERQMGHSPRVQFRPVVLRGAGTGPQKHRRSQQLYRQGRQGDFTTQSPEGHSFSEGLAAVQVVQDQGREVWQYVDRTGKVVIPNLRYRFVGIFREGVAFVEDNRMGWGLIDRTGKVVLKPQLTGISLFHHGLARVETGAFFQALASAIDTQGKWIWKPRK